MNRITVFARVLGLAVVSAAAWAQAPALPEDLAERQLKAEAADKDWLLYGGNYKAWRYSTLDQINKDNVRGLRPAWTLETGLHDAFECSPIVVDGVMYVTTPWNHVYAIDARTGSVYWHYAYPVERSLPLCCGAVNRGPAVGHGCVYFASLDCHLVALDAKTGEQIWDTEVADKNQGYSLTVAPQIIGQKVIVGASGGDFGIRGFIDAYDTLSGARIWRFWTIPAPGEPGHDTWEGDSWKTGGGPAWMTVTYDKDTNTILAGTGNPGPDLEGSNREGDNLYTECTLALDADTGKLKWHYQALPHDVWDLDNVIEPVIDEVKVKGRKRKVVMFASKNG